MFVVRRPFRTSKGVITAGSVVEPADIKRFKRFKHEGRIITVNEDNYERYKEFFKVRFNVDLPSLNGEPTQESLDIDVETVDVPEEATEAEAEEENVESPVEGQQKLPLDKPETQTTKVKVKPKAQVKVSATVK